MKRLNPEDVTQFIDGIVFVEQSLEQVRNYLHLLCENLVICGFVKQMYIECCLGKVNQRFQIFIFSYQLVPDWKLWDVLWNIVVHKVGKRKELMITGTVLNPVFD